MCLIKQDIQKCSLPPPLDLKPRPLCLPPRENLADLDLRPQAHIPPPASPLVPGQRTPTLPTVSWMKLPLEKVSSMTVEGRRLFNSPPPRGSEEEDIRANGTNPELRMCMVVWAVPTEGRTTTAVSCTFASSNTSANSSRSTVRFGLLSGDHCRTVVALPEEARYEKYGGHLGMVETVKSSRPVATASTPA